VKKMGKILRLDLTTQQTRIEDVDPSYEKRYLGGTGVAAAIFTREVKPSVNAFDPENLLIFSTGPFCGTIIPYCGRHFIMAKSPLTNIIGESSAGGFFGKELKFTGFDHIIFNGKSDKPVYLTIKDENVEFKEALEIWGKGIRETEGYIKKDLDDLNIKIASIGPAGENLVKYACIINEGGHAAGRCGMGAVMGSKNLKALAVRGVKKVQVKDEEELKQHAKELRDLAANSPMSQIMHDFGTLIHMDNYVSSGDVPIKNFTSSRWKGTKKIGAYALKDQYEIKHYGCFNCPTACRGKIKYKDEWVAWPEYEELAMLGANLLNDKLETLVEWNVLVNDLGVDCISLGGVLGVFLEALKRNLLDIDPKTFGFKKDSETGEFKIWGETEPLEKIIRMIGNRTGIGDILAEGTKLFCENKNLPEDLELHVKGLEIPAHEPRANNMTALDYATSSRGAYHCFEPLHLSFVMNLKEELGLTERIDPFGKEETVEAVKKIQDASEAYIACGGCIFGFWYIHKITPWVESLNAITGNSYDVDTWVKAGENIFNMKREYNIKCGISKQRDTLSPRFFKPIKKGGTKQNIPPLEEMREKYYRLRGWNKEGIPK
jgi:aldehyde:ferredoxin oxidoreductase